MLRRNLVANFLGQASGALLALLFIPVYVRALGMESFGLIGLYSALFAVLSIVDSSIQALLGRSAAQSRAASQMSGLADKLRSFEVSLSLLGSALILCVFLGSDTLGEHALNREALDASTVGTAFVAMSVALSLRLFEGLYRACLMGMERQVAFNAIYIVSQICRWGGAAVIVSWLSPSISSFFLWHAFTAAATVLILALTTYRSVGQMGNATVRFRSLWEERRFIGGMMVISIGAVLLTQTDKLLLAKLLPLAQFGDYALAATAAAALLLFVGPISDALYPRLVAHWTTNSQAGYVENFHLGAQLVAALAGTVALVAIAFANTILSIWTRDPELAQRVTPIFQVLVLGNLLNAFMWIPYRAQLAAGWTGLAARINLTAVLCLVPTLLIVTPIYGPAGAAWVWVALNLGYLSLGVRFMFKRILQKEELRWYLGALAMPICAAAIPIATIAWLTQHEHNQLIRIGSAAIAFGLGCGCAALASSSLRRLILKRIAITTR